jgi:hypothetical protein
MALVELANRLHLKRLLGVIVGVHTWVVLTEMDRTPMPHSDEGERERERERLSCFIYFI